MEFTLPTLLTIGLPLAAAPLLIHLINLRRRRRVAWAAMDFLLQSQKRSQKWILLQQLLLLLLRTAAIALVAFMLAGPVATSAWARFLGGGVTHHLILLDDSYSMGDRWDQSSAFEQAQQAVASILRQADHRAESQLVTILRFSESGDLTAGGGADVDGRALGSELQEEIGALLESWQPAESVAGPIEALSAAGRLPEPTDDETRIAYVVSDFRQAQWREQEQVSRLFRELRGKCEQLQLVHCVGETRPNLAITRLAPESGLRAAGVECWMELSVVNHGPTPRAADVEIEQDGAPAPAVRFDEIPAGEEVTRRFRAVFAEPGPHQLVARLESDALTADNVRYFAADVPATLPVLIVDGSKEGDDGNYLRTALSPGGKNLAGWSPQVEPTSFLRRHELLANFAAIYLLDVPRLDPTEISALEQYVNSGGGVGIFLGPATLPETYNAQWYRNGAGLMPAPLDVPTQLLRARSTTEPDVAASDHPVFRVFRGKRNSFLALADVDFYYAVRAPWSLPDDGSVRVLARLRSGAPFVLEKKLGEGHVVAQLCKLSPRPTELGAWSNWGLNPVFPVYANELTGHLSSARRDVESYASGEKLVIAAAEDQYAPEVVVVPPENANGRATTLLAAADDGMYEVEAPGTSVSGVWTFQLQRRDDEIERRLIAVNIPRGDSDLQTLNRRGLADRLPDLDFEYLVAGELTAGEQELAGYRLGDAALFILIAALAVEQALAAAASYHRRSGRSA